MGSVLQAQDFCELGRSFWEWEHTWEWGQCRTSRELGPAASASPTTAHARYVCFTTPFASFQTIFRPTSTADRPPKRDLDTAFSAPSPPLNARSPANGAPTPTLTGGFTLKRLLENREEDPPSHSLADAFSAPGRDSASGGRVFQDICTGGVLPEEDVNFIFELCVAPDTDLVLTTRPLQLFPTP